MAEHTQSLRVFPTLEEVSALATRKACDLVPVACELYADETTPLMVLRKLQQVSTHCYLLESVEHGTQGRYTFLGYDPSAEIVCAQGHLRVQAESTTEFFTNDPAAQIRTLLQRYRSPRIEHMPPFTGGLVGYFSYDYITYAEPSLHFDTADTENFNDVDLMLFDKVIAFDHVRNIIVLIANARTDDIEEGYRRAVNELETMRHLVLYGHPHPAEAGRISGSWTSLFDETSFSDVVRQAQSAIREGEIFQVVLSNRLTAPFEGSLLDTYRVLRTTNPSPYMFYLAGTDIELAGASPETLVKLQGNIVRTFPLAGTRPRGAAPEEDTRIEAELLHDEKELAEHYMLVDLGRNDLGKISEYGSVQVERSLSVERFSHVMHLGSTVCGTLRADQDALDALASVLPAGTLSGAPKIRACQIINNLERCKRGIYGGALGYLSFTGDMDMCIAIRMAFKKNGRIFVQSGAGIVTDSVPQREYEETLNKARAVRAALERAQGGLFS